MKTNPKDMHIAAESATGCVGAGSYLSFARENGYKFIEVLNWSSSAGDWEFIVSKDGEEWHILTQTSNYPRPGFSHSVGERDVFFGKPEEVLQEIERMFD